jgi:1-deoxy-D-xylulose-5-phosphate reductoisomerase
MGEEKKAIRRIILTASGGPFRDLSVSQLRNVTREEALRHPNWDMGPKITIDSATLMNKGLEVIEARWLFSLSLDQIEIAIHPQSIVHSMVEFVDGSIKAQLGLPDMRIPIQFALTYPRRLPGYFPRLDFGSPFDLQFYPPDFERFPTLRLAFEAARTAGGAPAVLNAANEVAVTYFLQGRIKFHDIARLIGTALESSEFNHARSLDEIVAADQWAREFVRRNVEIEKPESGF